MSRQAGLPRTARRGGPRATRRGRSRRGRRGRRRARPPERRQRAGAAGVVPHARRDGAAGAGHPRHLAQPGDRVRHEVHDQLGQRERRTRRRRTAGPPPPRRVRRCPGNRCAPPRRTGPTVRSRPRAVDADPVHQPRGQRTRPAARRRAPAGPAATPAYATNSSASGSANRPMNRKYASAATSNDTPRTLRPANADPSETYRRVERRSLLTGQARRAVRSRYSHRMVPPPSLARSPRSASSWSRAAARSGWSASDL